MYTTHLLRECIAVDGVVKVPLSTLHNLLCAVHHHQVLTLGPDNEAHDTFHYL